MTGGAGNTSTITQTGTLGKATITSVGATNTYTVSQSGGGTAGHTTVIDVTGSGNTASVTQAGTSGDSVANLKSVGSGNTFTVNSNTK